MSVDEKLEGNSSADKDGLRIVLDPEANRAFSEMSTRLKTVGSYVKFYPSQLVSFIVSDFFETYFEKDMDALVSKFFDAKAYIATEVQRAQNADEAVEILKGLSDSIDKIKGKGRSSGCARVRSGNVARGRRMNRITYEKEEV